MKKLLAALIAASLALTLLGCEGKTPTPKTAETASTEIVHDTQALETQISEKSAHSLGGTEITESVVFDNGDFKLTAKEIDFSDGYYVKVKFLAENNTDKNVSFTGTHFTINGITIPCRFYIKVASGKKANDFLEISKDDLEYVGISQIASIIAQDTDIIDNDSYDTIEEFCFEIKTSAYQDVQQEIDDSGELLYDQNGIIVKYRGIVKVGDSSEELEFYVENKEESSLIVSVDNVSVNGFTLYGSMVANAYPNSVCYERISFLSDDLEQNDISQIEEVSFNLYAYDQNTYKTVWTSDEVTVGRTPSTASVKSTNPIEETEPTESIWTSEALEALLLSSSGSFDYVGANVNENVAEYSTGINDLNSKVIEALTIKEWSEFKETVFEAYSNMYEVIKEPMNGRKFVFHVVDAKNPDVIFLTISDGEFTYDYKNK